MCAVWWACGSDSPDSVAAQFWEAVATGDSVTAAKFVTAQSVASIDAPALPVPDGPVQFEEPMANERAAIVRTRMTTSEGEFALEIEFDTHLSFEAEHWRVDLVATRGEASRAVFAAGMRQLGESIGQGFQEFGEALESGVEDVRAAVDEALRGVEEG
jgi:hypothetical protein